VHTVLFPSQAEDLIRADARYSYTAIDPDIEEKLAAERSELAAPAVAVAAELWDAAIFGVMDLLSKESEAAPALAEVVMAEELEEVKEVEASLTTLASDDSVDDPALGHGGFLIKVGHGYTHPPKKCYFVFDQSNGAVYYCALARRTHYRSTARRLLVPRANADKSQKDGLLGTNVLGKLVRGACGIAAVCHCVACRQIAKVDARSSCFRKRWLTCAMCRTSRSSSTLFPWLGASCT